MATGVLFFSGIKLANLALIVGFLVVGSVLGLVAARRVKMTAMPQLVALFNGVGGGAAALIAVVEYLVVDSDDLDVSDQLMFQKEVLYFDRIYVFSTSDQHVFDTSCDLYISVFIKDSEIS